MSTDRSKEDDEISRLTQSMEQVSVLPETPAQKEETLQNDGNENEVPAESVSCMDAAEEELEEGEVVDGKRFSL